MMQVKLCQIQNFQAHKCEKKEKESPSGFFICLSVQQKYYIELYFDMECKYKYYAIIKERVTFLLFFAAD